MPLKLRQFELDNVIADAFDERGQTKNELLDMLNCWHVT
jgi:hypothetical protein